MALLRLGFFCFPGLADMLGGQHVVMWMRGPVVIVSMGCGLGRNKGPTWPWGCDLCIVQAVIEAVVFMFQSLDVALFKS